jgi:hypothetical protein
VAAGLEPREPLEIPNVAPSETTTEWEAPSVDVDAAGDHEGRGADALVLQSVMTPQSDLALVSALFGVHLASYRAEASALDGWDTLQEQFPNEIGALKPRLAPFADPQRGDFLRLIAGPVASEDAAQAICETLRQTGAYCAVTAYMGRKM